MSSSDIEQRLTKAIQSNNFLEEAAQLVQELEKAGASVDVVEPILRFMEAHSEEDFGTPGELVHFVEHFYRQGYEEKLLQSLQRKPTAHTLWMLHALLNGTKDENERNYYLGNFREALTHPRAGDRAREAAARYLGYH